jgi:hypothetical protein
VSGLRQTGNRNGIRLTDRFEATPAMTDDLTLLQIAMRVGMSCASTAVLAAGIFTIIRISAWLG